TPNAGYDVGSETINLAASKGVVDTIDIGDSTVATYNGAKGGVAGFQANAANNFTSPSDHLDFNEITSGPVTALANITTPTIVSTFIADLTNLAADETALRLAGVD